MSFLFCASSNDSGATAKIPEAKYGDKMAFVSTLSLSHSTLQLSQLPNQQNVGEIGGSAKILTLS